MEPEGSKSLIRRSCRLELNIRMINQIGRLKAWNTFLWAGKGTSAMLFKKDDEVLEYVNALNFLADHRFTPQKRTSPIGFS
jgi:hypothetical protein